MIIWRVLLRLLRNGQLHGALLLYTIIKQKLLLWKRCGVMTATARPLFLLGGLSLKLAVTTVSRC